jgi:hypothetical protein
LRIPASLSPSNILGGSDLAAAAAACSNWIQILHSIAFTSFEAYTFYSVSGFARLNARVVQCLESHVCPHRRRYRGRLETVELLASSLKTLLQTSVRQVRNSSKGAIP